MPLRYSLDWPEWDPKAVWHKSLAIASSWEVRLLHSVFFLGTGRIYPIVRKIANLPLRKARWHVLFSIGTIIFLPSFLPPLAWRTLANIEALTKFTHQALNDSWPSLSLLNTEIALLRKLPRKIGWPWTFLLLWKEAPEPLSKQNVVCSYLISLLMGRLYQITSGHKWTPLIWPPV